MASLAVAGRHTISPVPYRDDLQPPTERKFWHGPEVATSSSAERNGFDELRVLS